MQRLLAAIIFILASGSARAGSFKFVTLEFPPLEFQGEKDEIQGAAVDIVRSVMSGLGHTLSIELLPWTRSLALVKAGQADAIFTAYRNEEREQFLDYSKEVLVNQVVALYARRGSDIAFNGNLKQLAPYTVGIISTISYGSKFDLARDGGIFKTDRADSLELNFRKLIAGRVDLVISNSFSANIEMDRLALRDQIMELKAPVEVLPSYIAFSKERKLTRLRDKFDARLRQLKKSGAYGKILTKYGVNQN